MRWSHRSLPTPRSGGGRQRVHALVLVLGALACAVGAQAQSTVHDAPLRVRIAYGGDAPAAWRGEVRAEGASLGELRALPVEPDPIGGVWPAGEAIEIAHAVPRLRGALDVTLGGRKDATLSVRIASPDGAANVEAVFHAADLAGGDPLVEQGPGGLRVVAQRLTDDRLRIVHEREELVFEPNQRFAFEVVADPPGVQPGTSYEFLAELREAETGRVVWSEPARRVDAPVDGFASLPVEVPLPAGEGIYRVALRVIRPAGFTSRFRVGGSTKALAVREFEVVVFDQRAAATSLGEWRETYAFNPASPTWRDRLPAWTGWRRLPWVDAGSFGSSNGRGTPPVRGDYVEIQPTGRREEVNWQAYPLAIPVAGTPVLLEVELPADEPQQLGLTLLDENPEGRLVPVGDGVVTETPSWGRSPAPRVARLVCWPRTEGPLLVVHNPSADRPARFGRVRVLQAERVPTTPKAAATPVLLDFDDPRFGRFVGLDPRAVSESPAKALIAARRLADLVESAGANGAVVTVNRGGAAIYPDSLLGRSARFDGGVWASGANDLPGFSQLGLLRRVFDRRGLKLTPAVDFDTPLPAVVRETLRASAPSPATHTALDPRTRGAMIAVMKRLNRQSAKHASHAGIAIRTGPDSALLTTRDDSVFGVATVDRFLAQQGLRWPDGVPRGPAEHAVAIRENLGEAWNNWRREQLTAFYTESTDRLGAPPMLLGRELHALPRLVTETTPRLGREALPSAVLETLGLGDLPLVHPTALALHEPLGRFASETMASTLLIESTQADQPAGSPIATRSISRRAHLVNADQWLGGETSVRSIEAPSGDEARVLAAALASEQRSPIVDGGAASIGWSDETTVELRRLLRLRGGGLAVTSTTTSGVTAITERAGDDTLLYAVSVSPWTTQGRIALKTDGRCLATPLDAERGAGVLLEEGEGELVFTLKPYGARVWRLLSAEAAVDFVYAAPDESAEAEVVERLADFQRRDRTARRPTALIGNPSFESVDGLGEVAGWQARRGVATSVTTAAGDLQRSLSLASRGEGAELLSEPFASPETGQLAVTFAAKPVDLDPTSMLRIALEQDGGEYDVQTTVPAESLSAGDASGWRELVFAVDDLPLGDGPPLRLRLSFEGRGEILLDGIRTETLKLPLPSYADDLRAEKLALVRLQRNAEQALQEKRLADCRELLDGYWARFVAAYFPIESKSAVTPIPPEPTASDKTVLSSEEEPEVADRWRRYLPGFLR